METRKLTRFDLEKEIMSCWSIIDDLELLEDNPKLLQSIKEIYGCKFKKMFETFEELISKNKL